MKSLLPIVLGCATLSCGDDPDSWPEGRPRIEELRFVQQSPQDPYALEFLIRFADTDGNTGAGKLHLFVNEEEVSTLQLTEVFQNQSPPITLDAVEGELEVVVRMSADVEIGRTIRVGFSIEDGAEERSNDPWIELRGLAE